jgi:Spy/CpxP family protein refolding chaperone
MIRQIHIATMGVALTVLLAGGAAIYAQGSGGPRGRGPGGFGPGGPPAAGLALRELNLNDTQQEQVRQLMTQYREQVGALNDRLESDIRALLTPEQQQKADTLRADREARMKERRQRNQTPNVP